jgi:predicted ATPase
VVFLDDLQWADAATLALLPSLFTAPDERFLFLIGAYRDNEVGPAHPVMRTLESLASAGVPLHRMTLGLLGLDDLTRFVGDTLHADAIEARPLAGLMLEKAGGNPFFVIQFMKGLHQEGLVA